MSLSKNDLKEFRQRLEELKLQLTSSLKEVSKDVKTGDESKGYSQHQADEGTDDFGRTISLEVTSKEAGIIRQINRCLEKLEEGTYGICDVTHEEIPRARLEAIPYATMTVQAQSRIEQGLL